jgi:hypothetical protein
MAYSLTVSGRMSSTIVRDEQAAIHHGRGHGAARIAAGKVTRQVCRILVAGPRPLLGAVRVFRHDCLRSTDNIGRRVGLLAPQRRQDGLSRQPVVPSARGVMQASDLMLIAGKVDVPFKFPTKPNCQMCTRKNIHFHRVSIGG